MSAVLDLSAARAKKREAQMREQFGVEPDETMVPVGFVASALIDRLRLRMAERRNREATR